MNLKMRQCSFHPFPKANAGRHPRFERPRNAQVNLEVNPSFWRCFETPPTSGDTSWTFFCITPMTSKTTQMKPAYINYFLESSKPHLKPKMTFRLASAQSLWEFQKPAGLLCNTLQVTAPLSRSLICTSTNEKTLTRCCSLAHSLFPSTLNKP